MSCQRVENFFNSYSYSNWSPQNQHRYDHISFYANSILTFTAAHAFFLAQSSCFIPACLIGVVFRHEIKAVADKITKVWHTHHWMYRVAFMGAAFVFHPPVGIIATFGGLYFGGKFTSDRLEQAPPNPEVPNQEENRLKKILDIFLATVLTVVAYLPNPGYFWVAIAIGLVASDKVKVVASEICTVWASFHTLTKGYLIFIGGLLSPPIPITTLFISTLWGTYLGHKLAN